jgi:hypothetical protein
MFSRKERGKLKIGFSNGKLTLNSKEFNPLNLSVKGHGLECNEPIKTVDPFELLDSLASVNNAQATREDKVKGLKAMLDKLSL